MSQLIIDVQRASACAPLPGDIALHAWAQAALAGRRERAEMALRIVDEAESRKFNCRYRNRDRPTNVLSFAADLPAEVDLPLLGDLIICAPIVAREARQQHKSLVAHWAHLVVHGTLHLLGYDHIDDGDAEIMEQLEIQILAGLGFDDPYKAVSEPIAAQRYAYNSGE